jgi:hypothetical protein
MSRAREVPPLLTQPNQVFWLVRPDVPQQLVSGFQAAALKGLPSPTTTAANDRRCVTSAKASPRFLHPGPWTRLGKAAEAVSSSIRVWVGAQGICRSSHASCQAMG